LHCRSGLEIRQTINPGYILRFLFTLTPMFFNRTLNSKEMAIVGQQLNKVIKQARRKRYLQRLKARRRVEARKKK